MSLTISMIDNNPAYFIRKVLFIRTKAESKGEGEELWQKPSDFHCFLGPPSDEVFKYGLN